MTGMVSVFALTATFLLSGCGGGSSGGGNVTPPTPQGPPGTLDSSFGTGGSVISAFGSYADGASVVVQSDGKILVAGQDFGVARFNADGTLDLGFGANGTAAMRIGSGVGAAKAVATQPDGKIVVVGNQVVQTDVAVKSYCAILRFNSDGSPDVSFGTGGAVVTGIANGNNVGCLAVVVQPDGKIVAAGGTFGVYPVFRLNVDGSRDMSFGNGGEVLTGCGQYSCAIATVLIQPDGKIVVAGSAITAQIPVYFAIGLVARYDASGVLDPGFGAGGIEYIGGRVAPFTTVSSAALQPDGKIVVAGGYCGNCYEISQYLLARLLPNGSLDPGFGTGGIVLSGLGGSGTVGLGVAVQTNGKIVIAGTKFPTGVMVARHDAVGAPDSTFGTAGITISPIAVTATAEAMTLQNDGRIVVAGTAQTEIGTGGLQAQSKVLVARYFGN